MTNLNLWDHVFALTVFLIYPVYSKLTIRGVLDHIREQGQAVRISAYRRVIATWIGFTICLLAIWVLFDRDWAELGLRFPEAIPLAGGLAIAIFFILLVVIPLRSISRSPERSHELANQMGDIALFMPRSKTEESWFKVVSINAGLCEELIFRGYLMWYLGHFLESWWAAATAAVLFGFAHMYQGWKQLPGILLISAVAVSLYVYTGSLLVPVLFHIFLDALQGHYIARIQRSRESSS